MTRRDGVTLRFRVTDGSSCASTPPASTRSPAGRAWCSPPAGRSTAKVPGPLRYLVEAELIADSAGTRAGLLIHEDGDGPEPALKT